MTRTQITLEREEYQFLKTRAAEQSTSLSAVIRALVRDTMERTYADRPLIRELVGIITESDFSGKDHDRVLYGPSATEQEGGAG